MHGVVTHRAQLVQALERASGKYKRLNAAAMAVTKPGGLLMTCSCSGAVAQGAGLLPILLVRAVPYLLLVCQGALAFLLLPYLACEPPTLLFLCEREGCMQEAAQQAKRRISVVREAGAAPCHPIIPAYPEGRYLTNVLVCVH